MIRASVVAGTKGADRHGQKWRSAKVGCKLNLAQEGIDCLSGQLHTRTKRTPLEIQNPTHCILIGCNMPPLPPLLSPNSIPLVTSSQCAYIPSRNNWARFRHVKVKVKFRSGALQHYSLNGLLYSDPHGAPLFISRGAAHQRRERPQLAKEGTIDGI
jgi:hypothetical protein